MSWRREREEMSVTFRAPNTDTTESKRIGLLLSTGVEGRAALLLPQIVDIEGTEGHVRLFLK